MSREDEDRDHADLCMKEAMLSFALRHQGPAALLVVTCDQDYLPVMKLMKENGITLMHAYTKASTTQKLIDVTAEPMIWHDLVKGKLLPVNFSVDNFNVPQPPPSPPHRDPPPLIQNSESKMRTYYDIGSCPLPASISCVSLRENIHSLLPKVVGGFAGVLEMAVYYKAGYFEESAVKNRV